MEYELKKLLIEEINLMIDSNSAMNQLSHNINASSSEEELDEIRENLIKLLNMNFEYLSNLKVNIQSQ